MREALETWIDGCAGREVTDEVTRRAGGLVVAAAIRRICGGG